MKWESKTGLGVRASYGPRNLGQGIAGNIETVGPVQELTFDFSGYAIKNNKDFFKGLLPKGAKVLEATLAVKEAFALGGTTPTFNVGTVGSEATNGITFTETQLETAGVFIESSTKGTWQQALAANTNVSFALGGTTPTIGDQGKARLTISYVKI